MRNGKRRKKQKNEEVRKILKKGVGPLFYRVRKADLDLKPAIFHKPIIIKMNCFIIYVIFCSNF